MILEGGSIVVQQIIILFLMIGLGVVAAHFGLLKEEGTRQLTELLLIIITPCVIIMAFQLSFERSLIKNILIAAFLGALTPTIGIFVSKLFFRNTSLERNVMLRYATIFYNSGFFSLPLIRAFFGNTGALYGSVFIGVINIFFWTYGVYLMTGKKNASKLKTFLNPGTIAVLIAITLVLLKIKLPGIINSTLTYVASMHTPLAMMIIGSQFYLYKQDFKLLDGSLWKTVLTRNIIVPLIMLLLNYYLVEDKTLYFTSVIIAAAPTATNTVLFATKFKQDVSTAIQTVMLTTVMTIFTIPLMMGLAMLLKGSL